MDATELKQRLAYFIGSEQCFFTRPFVWLNYTEGFRFFMQNAGGGAYWFLTFIATKIPRKMLGTQSFFAIKLIVSDHSTDKVEFSDGDTVFKTCKIGYTDCPQGEWSFYLALASVENGKRKFMLMLPTEY